MMEGRIAYQGIVKHVFDVLSQDPPHTEPPPCHTAQAALGSMDRLEDRI